MKTLIIAEHNNQSLKPDTLLVMSAALQLGQEVHLLIIGFQCESVVKQIEKITGVHKILVADASEYQHQLAENTAPLVAEIASQYDYVLVGANTFGKNLLPRVAALLDVNMVTDVVKIISTDTFIRPAYAGNVLATVKIQEKIKLLTIRTTAFSPAKLTESQTIPIEKISKIIPNELSKFINQESASSLRPELTAARIVISGGRGLKSAENFKMLETLADHLGAAVGASRAAVDAGFVPNNYQVGQTGKIVAPDLYIAIGISGAIQHLAGIKDSKIIVAINSDPDAPIFEVADYGLVGDLFKLIPELQAELSKH